MLDIDADLLDDLLEEWERWPPLRKMVAAALGHKPKPKPSRDYMSLVGMFSNTGGLLK